MKQYELKIILFELRWLSQPSKCIYFISETPNFATKTTRKVAQFCDKHPKKSCPILLKIGKIKG